jgi:hypothetical protein
MWENISTERRCKVVFYLRQRARVVKCQGSVSVGSALRATLGALLFNGRCFAPRPYTHTQVILSPNAVTADGGAICPSGMLMVCIAAKVRSP